MRSRVESLSWGCRACADEKRADLSVELISDDKHLAAPIEIKKEDNKTLWSAWHDQLQALYTIDPNADGHGIYLVLWFGFEPKASPDSELPTSAQMLQRMLAGLIPAEDRKRLAVCVLDLSLPAGRAPRS